MNKVKAKHILVKQQHEVDDLLRKLNEGTSFEDLAKSFSQCPSGKQGGDLGEFGRGQMVKEFEAAAFGLEPEQISAPVKTQFGYHLIKRYS